MWPELSSEIKKPGFLSLREFVDRERATKRVYPPQDKVFRAFDLTSYERVKVVILGQDPYHGEGQANGLAFAVENTNPFPPSLRNIFKEIEREYGEAPAKKDLVSWAEQGVLLLNTALTVEEGRANSHQGKGWEAFTDGVIRTLNEREKPVVFLLWGANAASKEKLITEKRHCVLKAPHPSPLSAHRGFFGCDHFIKANEALEKWGEKPVDWVGKGFSA